MPSASRHSRPYLGPDRSEPTITSSQLSGTNNTGVHHNSASAGVARAPSARHSHTHHSEHRSHRSRHSHHSHFSQPREPAFPPAEAAQAEPFVQRSRTHHSNHAQPNEAEFAPASHHSSRESTPSYCSENDAKVFHDPAPHVFDKDQGPRMDKAKGKGKNTIGGDELVPKLLWVCAGGTGPRPTVKQWKEMKNRSK
ncbi:MAG: hypothetical protein M1835_000218 [Candelina submexicana]|nr:MAG: hypothetical protein M1835_000218 [Candelina submexicana]